MLQELGFTPKWYRIRVFLYRQREIHRYFEEVGSSNAYHLGRYHKFTSDSTAQLGR